MRSLWICFLLWESLPKLQAHPISSELSPDNNESYDHWELNWFKYAVGLLGITITAFTLVGCLCCRRNSRPKGFQDSEGSITKEFKGLELQVPVSVSEHVQFEPLPVERIFPETCASRRPKPPPPSPSLLEEEAESDRSTLQDSCKEWFQKTDLHVPREKVKYLREIGHGWFGKVVKGFAEVQCTALQGNVENKNVIVRILTEEATAKEKAWFLGEATPYFKLRHRNILSLVGSCLETDPYLLLFESCVLGDLKCFLRSNQDPQSQRALIKENMPTRIAIEIGAGLRHMHEHKLTHTDLAARNCLVAADLSIKLGDYGTAVEKYPEDYYVLGDRALPIRWSAPETIDCTDTTIETREITPRANLWSYAVLLWEIAMWGKRPYDDLGDEKVIEMLLSSKSGMKPIGSQLLLQNSENCASNLLEAIKTCLVLDPNKRFPLEQVRHVLLKEQLEAETVGFEQRWETLRPNNSRDQTRSASLQDLRGSLDSEQWPSLTQTSFRLGPEEPVKNVPGGPARSGKYPFRDSDSETEEESWRGRVERGAYTEKVKQKSKSVADLMVLVHIEPDSDADLSLGPQTPMIEKNLSKKRLPATGSDGDLPSAIFDDQFDLALRMLRDAPVPGNSLRGPKTITPFVSLTEKSNLFSLTPSQEQTPIARVSFDGKVESMRKEDFFVKSTVEEVTVKESAPDFQSCKENVQRLLPTNDIEGPLLRCYNKSEDNSTTTNRSEISNSPTAMAVNDEDAVPTCFSNNFHVTDLNEDKSCDKNLVKDNNCVKKDKAVDVNLWNSALDSDLEQKSADFIVQATPSPMRKIEATNEEGITPSPQSRAEYSAEEAEDEYSNGEDLPGLSKRNLPMDDEDERKRMSTPDDERSSDSGFRDKESCEEEESPLAGPLLTMSTSQPNTPRSHEGTEEEMMRTLFELDMILDAECISALHDSLDPNVETKIVQSPNSPMSNISAKELDVETETSETVQSSSETTGETEKQVMQIDKSSSDDANLSCSLDTNVNCSAMLDFQPIETETIPVDSNARSLLVNEEINLDNTQTIITGESNSWPCLTLGDNEDEDSSTMSLRSDNSYVSFGMDEEFVTAIRNELREKLPQAQMSVIEAQEPRDEDEPSLLSDVDSKNWDDDVEEELTDRRGVDISIRYNTYGTPLSPILEERESAGNSESANLTRDDSRDVSIASKGGSNSLSEDDVLMIDMQTNRATLVEGTLSLSQDSQDLSTSEDENRMFNVNHQHNRPLYPLDRRFGGILTGGTGVPLPSPEDDACKWQQQISDFSMLPPQLEDNLMSTSFASEQDWDSDEEENGDGPSESMVNELDEDDDDDDGEEDVMDDDDDDDDDDDEENSSSSGEFVWQQYGASHLESHETENSKKDRTDNEEDDQEAERDPGEDFETEDEEEEEFTPSAWDATLAPHRSALRSPDKTMKTGDQKKSVWFKKQRYHCVYEYPKETPPTENQSPVTTAWEPTSCIDWEEMIDSIDRMNFQPMDYFESNNTRDDEFFVSSSNRPFQFQSGNGKYISQFFPGASSAGVAATSQEVPAQESSNPQSENAQSVQSFSDRQQLGELRHTRDRLKLNLTSNGVNNNRAIQLCNPVKQGINLDDEDEDDSGEEEKEKKDVVEEKSVEEVKPTEGSSEVVNKDSDVKEEFHENAEKEAPADTLISADTSAVVEQSILTAVKTSPLDEQCSVNIEVKSNSDNFDVD